MTPEEAKAKGITTLTEEQMAQPDTAAANILTAARDGFAEARGGRQPDASEFELAVGVALGDLAGFCHSQIKLNAAQFKQMLKDLGFLPEFVDSRISEGAYGGKP
jgi:hypothetical protein